MRDANSRSKSIIIFLLISIFSLTCFAYDGDAILDNVQPEGGGTLDILNIKDVTGIDSTTEATIENAIDTLPNLTSIQSQTISLLGSLTVESTSVLNQDLTTDASPTFAGATFTGPVTGIALNEIEDPTTDKTFTMANKTLTFRFTNPSGGVAMEWTGDASGHLFELKQDTGNPTTTYMMHLEWSDPDVIGIHMQASSSSDIAEIINVAGDADYRLHIHADGLFDWGDGTNATDTNLYRSTADTLKTDDNFVIGSMGSYTSHPTFTSDTEIVDKKYVDDSISAVGSIPFYNESGVLEKIALTSNSEIPFYNESGVQDNIALIIP